MVIAYLINKKESIMTDENSLFEIHRHIMFLATREELDEVIKSVEIRRNDLLRKEGQDES